MILWLNGAYGSGKSTTAERIRALRLGSILFDAEKIGDAIRDNLEPVDYRIEYPEYPIWRETVTKLLLLLSEKTTELILVDMTVLQSAYLEEIFRELTARGIPYRHIILELPPDIIRERILARGEEVDCWCDQQRERCAALLQTLPGIRMDGTKPVDALAEAILALSDT